MTPGGRRSSATEAPRPRSAFGAPRAACRRVTPPGQGHLPVIHRHLPAAPADAGWSYCPWAKSGARAAWRSVWEGLYVLAAKVGKARNNALWPKAGQGRRRQERGRRVDGRRKLAASRPDRGCSSSPCPYIQQKTLSYTLACSNTPPEHAPHPSRPRLARQAPIRGAADATSTWDQL